MEGIVIVEGGTEAGSVVWWEMSGLCKLADLERALEDEGILWPELMPREPTLEAALFRAASNALPNSSSLLRPLGRGGWEAFAEEKFKDASGEDRVRLRSIAVGGVRRLDDGSRKVEVKPTGDGGEAFRDSALATLDHYAQHLMPADVSGWLLALCETGHVDATGLRQRGGFYFVPKQKLGFWRAVAQAVRAVSKHQLLELPAMRTEECAAAVLMAVRRESEQAFDEMDAYLAGPVSTKGLNSIERRIEASLKKVETYRALFEGNSLADLVDKTVMLTGALAAARVAHEVAGAAA